MKWLLWILLCPHLLFFTAAVMSCPPLKDGQTFSVFCNHSTTLDSSQVLEWTIERYQNVDLSVANCSLSNQTCSGPFSARLKVNGSFVESNLTDVKASTSYRNFKCRLSPSRMSAWSPCSGALVVYTPPENVTCDLPTVGTNVTVTCRTSKVSPGIRCEFFTRWSGDSASTKVNGTIEYKNEEYSLRVDGELVPYNASNCTLTVPRTSFLSGSHEISVRMFSSSNASKTDAVNSTAGSVTLGEYLCGTQYVFGT
ncbi:unnamed protein product [Lymnaea stagnalis]|uniref:Ig-like domain-containing protein n=1 Tax=Lymnaea stagnalis TaxID=6523 RepID=A0AAV2I6L7_LYMST